MHQVKFAKLFANGGDTIEFLSILGIRNSREIDFQEFLVALAIGWRMENTIDVIKDMLWSRSMFFLIVISAIFLIVIPAKAGISF